MSGVGYAATVEMAFPDMVPELYRLDQDAGNPAAVDASKLGLGIKLVRVGARSTPRVIPVVGSL